MNCLLCGILLEQNLKFHELFLLKVPQQKICQSCQNLFEKLPLPACPRCCKPDVQEICPDCKNWEEKGIIINHKAIFKYNSAMHDFFSQYKFLGDYRLRLVFANYFSNFDKNYQLVPIPLSQKRYAERGFNQVTAFLENGKYLELLNKKDSLKQSSLSREERLSSENPFFIKENVIVPEKIILIDDIYTTGTTLVHASKILRKAGAKDIKSFSLCR